MNWKKPLEKSSYNKPAQIETTYPGPIFDYLVKRGGLPKNADNV